MSSARDGLAVAGGCVLAGWEARVRYRWIAFWGVLAVALGLFGCESRAPRPGGGPPATPPPGARAEVAVRFLDIGQGDAALIQWPGGAALVDGGPEDANKGLLKKLRAAGVRRLDYVIATHPHADHIGGLVDVLREMPVAHVVDSGYNHGSQVQRRFLREIQKKPDITFELARPGEELQLAESLTLRFYAPPETPLSGTESDPNNNSIVARLTYGSTAFLFTGDLEKAGRAALYETLQTASGGRNALRADVLKVAHHGSHNGTDAELLDRVRPRYAVISCATGNSYGHPHRKALTALQKAGVELFRTDKQGDVTMRTDGTEIQASTEREATGSLWTAGRSATR